MDATTWKFWIVFLIVQVVTLFGYLGSSLPKWGKWRDAEIETRLSLLSGLAMSLACGNAVYFLAYYLQETMRIVALFLALGGGYFGERWLVPLLNKAMPSDVAPVEEKK